MHLYQDTRKSLWKMELNNKIILVKKIIEQLCKNFFLNMFFDEILMTACGV